MTQPEALRLADALDAYCTPQDVSEKAAAKLRRLHEENERCREVCKATSECWRADAEKWEAQRDALLEALKMLVLATKDFSVGNYNEEVHDIALSKARAAIKAAEENT